MEKAVLSLDELVEYTGWGKTKLRALLKDPNSNFTIYYPDLVFTTTFGSPVTRYVLTEDIKKILKIIDKNEAYMASIQDRKPVQFPHIHPHAFRHTFATRCFEKDLKHLFVMRVMGHENYETTISYTHLLDKSNETQVKLAGSFV